MGTRTVRLDEESERILAEVRRARQLSVSDALKEGLIALRDKVREEGPASEPFEVYSTLDLGPGGYARAAARRAKTAVAATLRQARR